MSRDALELDIGKAILTAYQEGHLGAQFDSEGDEGTAAAEVLSPFGLDSRVRDPDVNSDGTTGTGATAMHAYEGRTQHMWLYGDARATAALPQLEKGSSRLYAHLDGNKVTWLRLDGATGSAKLRVPVGAGESTVEVNGFTGDITLTPAPGAKVILDGIVEAGAASGGVPLVKEAPLSAWIATLISALAAAPGGPINVSPPTGIATTKVNGT